MNVMHKGVEACLRFDGLLARAPTDSGQEPIVGRSLRMAIPDLRWTVGREDRRAKVRAAPTAWAAVGN